MAAYIYLAGPYSSDDKFVQIARYRATLRACTQLMDAGELIFSPVVYGHPLEDKSRKNYTADYWMRWCKSMLAPAKSIYVLTLPGWESSNGLRTEVCMAHELEIPILGYSHGQDCEQVSGFEIIQEFGLSPRKRTLVMDFPRDDMRD